MCANGKLHESVYGKRQLTKLGWKVRTWRFVVPLLASTAQSFRVENTSFRSFGAIINEKGSEKGKWRCNITYYLVWIDPLK